MTSTSVWAFKRIKALNNAVGFVTCDSKLADRLIAEGEAQDPRVGGNHLKPIDYSIAAEPVYETKVVTPAKPKRKKVADDESA